ncbi:PadR family transcriptional regulator [Gryllotalpicola protaetiae]|uniref:PadR family transcriptional regulator n=1 Tax=Gryllotalpicola protaetiae TaxID=2419771 RepID=A0A387BHQ5_9MICO|nr:PadR family transcriptional regulator [Gryllotalpicola protaetiae]AYG03353.1 PadR family transcriptional regulator [Gryllotalpicola protaetiae]
MRLAKDLMAATSAPLVLAILAEGESYGYAIIARVRELSNGEIEWTDGLLYPLLHRLEGSALVASRWGQAESGRKRRYYEITDAGRDELAEHRRQWATAVGALTQARVLAQSVAHLRAHVVAHVVAQGSAQGKGTLAW